MAGLRIIGLGKATGDQVVTNEELSCRVDTSDQWIRQKSGIQSRFFAQKRSNSDMAAEAAEAAIKDAGISADSIAFVIVCTFTPDMFTPSVACSVAGRLGLEENVMAVDLNGACSGFIYGCLMADGLLRREDGGSRYGLVIGSEKISPLLDMTDRGTCVLFGDGAGASVVELGEESRFIYYGGCIPRDDILRCERGNRQAEPFIRMAGQEVYRFAVSVVPRCIEAVLEKGKLTPEKVDHYVCHQANGRIIDQVAQRLAGGTLKDRFYKNMYHYGNTSAASIPLALKDMETEGLFEKGGPVSRVICTGFGAGLTFGSMLVEVKR